MISNNVQYLVALAALPACDKNDWSSWEFMVMIGYDSMIKKMRSMDWL